MLLAENLDAHLKSARNSSNEKTLECRVHNDVGKIIPSTIDVENLVLAYKMIIAEYEKVGWNTVSCISVIPKYVRQGVSKEFFREFRKLYTSEIIGIDLPEFPEENYGCIEVEPEVIDISNKDKYEVFAKLYNYITPMSAGFGQYIPIPLDEQNAHFVFEQEGTKLDDGSVTFRYVCGRLMKCKFKDNLLYVAGYNYENEEGLAQMVVSTCKNVNAKAKNPQKVKTDK